MCIFITKYVVTVGKGCSGKGYLQAIQWVIFAWKHGYGLAAILRHRNGCPKWYPKQLVAFEKTKQGKGKLTRDLQHAQTVYLYIVYDFEALLGANKHLQATKDLRFENEHLLVSVSLADTLNREPEHISSNDPEELVRKFLGGVRAKVCRHPRRHAAIHPGGSRSPAGESAKADQPMIKNLIKKYFVTHIAKLGDVKVANKTRSCT